MNQESEKLSCPDCKNYNGCVMILSENFDEDNPEQCLDFENKQ
jgi:hypothetical protein